MNVDKERNQPERPRGGRPRTGSLIIEAVISVALLATAGYALTRLAGSAADLNQQSDRRLAATLIAENTIERLRGSSEGEVAERGSEVAEAVSEASGCEVRVTTEPFTTSRFKGIHLRVVVSVGSNIRVTAHDWRLTAASNSDDENSPTKSNDDDE